MSNKYGLPTAGLKPQIPCLAEGHLPIVTPQVHPRIRCASCDVRLCDLDCIYPACYVDLLFNIRTRGSVFRICERELDKLNTYLKVDVFGSAIHKGIDGGVTAFYV